MVQSVKIGPIDYAVEYVSNLKNGTRKLDGHINYNHTAIRLEKDMTPQASVQVLWHEVLHGVALQSGLDLTESEIDLLSYGVYQVLKDNPEFVKASTKKGK